MATAKQIAAIKYLVFQSQDGGELSKRIVAFLLDQSEGLSRTVHIHLEADVQGYTIEEIKHAWRGLSRMTSSHGSLHLNELLMAANEDAGTWSSTSETHCDFWITYRHDGRDMNGITIPTTRAELDAIDLVRPGLYPRLEN